MIKNLFYNVISSLFYKNSKVLAIESFLIDLFVIMPLICLMLILAKLCQYLEIDNAVLVISCITIPFFFFTRNKLIVFSGKVIKIALKRQQIKYSIFKAFSILLLFYLIYYLPLFLFVLYYASKAFKVI